MTTSQFWACSAPRTGALPVSPLSQLTPAAGRAESRSHGPTHLPHPPLTRSEDLSPLPRADLSLCPRRSWAPVQLSCYQRPIPAARPSPGPLTVGAEWPPAPGTSCLGPSIHLTALPLALCGPWSPPPSSSLPLCTLPGLSHGPSRGQQRSRSQRTLNVSAHLLHQFILCFQTLWHQHLL